MGTALVSKATIKAVAQARKAALEKMREAMYHLAESQGLVKEALNAAKAAHMGHAPHIGDGSPLRCLEQKVIDPELTMKAYRVHLDTGTWTHLIEASGMGEMMDRKAKDEMRSTFQTDDVPEATEGNLGATLETLFGRIDHIALRGIAEAFSKLDRRFKSHNGFRIGSRVIIDYLVDRHGFVNYGTQRDTLADVERAFAMVAKTPPNMGELWMTINRDRRGYEPQQSEHETRFFKIRIFKNGNAHLWFNDDELVKKVNKALGDWYGPLLPDAAGSHEPKGQFARKAGLPSKDLQFYATPQGLAEDMVEGLRLEGAEVLEPSAGEGVICRAAMAKGAKVTAVEIHGGRADTLRHIRGLTVVQENFLQTTPNPKYDYVLMNPPFYGTHWMEHVHHAFKFVKPGGALYSILPASAEVNDTSEHVKFREWVHSVISNKDWRGPFSDLPSGSFRESGTNIETVTLCMRKPK